MTPLPLLAFLLLCLPAPHAAGDSVPTPTPWPPQFHAKLLMDYRGNLSLADLWYDWPGGRNLHVIRYQLTADAPYYDAEWNNGTSFFYTPARRQCRSAEVGVGILRPDWLYHGAAYLGRAPADGFDCHAWAKADFITYYEDVRTRRPVKWVFYTGRTAHVMSFEVGAVLEDAEWQAPDYCFAEDDGAAKNTLTSEPDGHDESFIPDIRMLRGMTSSGCDDMPKEKVRDFVPNGLEISICWCQDPCRLMKSEDMSHTFERRFFMSRNYETEPVKVGCYDHCAPSSPPLCDYIQWVDTTQSKADEEQLRREALWRQEMFMERMDEAEQEEKRKRQDELQRKEKKEAERHAMEAQEAERTRKRELARRVKGERE